MDDRAHERTDLHAHRRSRRASSLALLPLALAAMALALAAMALATPGRAQQASVPAQLAGTWAYDGTSASAQHIIDSAFAPAIATLPELFQGFARSRVRSSMAPPHRVEVTISGNRVHVSIASSERTTVIDGALHSHAAVSGAEGSPTVTPRLSGGWLELLYEGEGSQLRQLLSTEPDGGRMHLDFHIVSPQIPNPVRYRLDFVRRP